MREASRSRVEDVKLRIQSRTKARHAKPAWGPRELYARSTRTAAAHDQPEVVIVKQQAHSLVAPRFQCLDVEHVRA